MRYRGYHTSQWREPTDLKSNVPPLMIGTALQLSKR